MKKLLCFIGLFLALFALKSHAGIPGGTIPFIFDSHLYLQVRLNDTIPVTVIYDTGADFLYLDEDYLKLNNLQNAFGKKGIARMGGAGNNEPQSVDIFIEPIKIHAIFSPTLISGAVGSIGARTSNQKFSKGPIKKHHARVPKCTKSLLTKKNTKNMIPSNTRATVPN